jgi:ERF superfamily
MDEQTSMVVSERPPNGQGAITRLLEAAVEKNLSVESLEKLVALYERMTDRQAAQEFADELAAFQAACPPIPKTSKAQVVSRRTGSSYTYHYASLDEIARTVQPLLHKHGFSYGWDSRHLDGGMLEAVCTLRHRNGHHETASFIIPVANESAMNEQQKHAAALTYARRQSLIAALGLTTAEPDTDGSDPTTPVSEDQLSRLEELFSEVRISKARFFKLLGQDITELREVPAVLFPTAVNLLLAKKRAQETGIPDRPTAEAAHDPS